MFYLSVDVLAQNNFDDESIDDERARKSDQQRTKWMAVGSDEHCSGTGESTRFYTARHKNEKWMVVGSTRFYTVKQKNEK